MTAKELKEKAKSMICTDYDYQYIFWDEEQLSEFINQLCKEQRELCAKHYEEEKYKMVLGEKKMSLIIELIMESPQPEI